MKSILEIVMVWLDALIFTANVVIHSSFGVKLASGKYRFSWQLNFSSISKLCVNAVQQLFVRRVCFHPFSLCLPVSPSSHNTFPVQPVTLTITMAIWQLYVKQFTLFMYSFISYILQDFHIRFYIHPEMPGDSSSITDILTDALYSWVKLYCIWMLLLCFALPWEFISIACSFSRIHSRFHLHSDPYAHCLPAFKCDVCDLFGPNKITFFSCSSFQRQVTLQRECDIIKSFKVGFSYCQ